jgi:DNA-binding response OmpR family regulator
VVSDEAHEHRPHLILLDLHLPDLPGERVLPELQSDEATRDADAPVVDVSPQESGLSAK